MSEITDNLLTEGLAEGYAGIKKPEKIQRSGFSGKANDFTIPEKGHYHDEWFADDNGGGQELVNQGEEKFTRLYGGGVIPVDELQKLGLTTNDVISRLITSVRELKEKTRLHEPCALELQDGWNYKYEIIKKSKEVPLTVGYESIELNGREVFAHAHILSPIK
jgi:hypothetical protein